MTISERIFKLLHNHSLTQKALADYLGIQPSTLNTWIKQNMEAIPSIYIMPICKLLCVTPEELLTGENEDHINVTDDEYKLLSIYRSTDEDTRIIIMASAIKESRNAK